MSESNPTSHLRINGNIYDIKDATARALIGDLNNLETTAKDNLVDAINEAAQGGGGGGGTSNYNSLSNKPQINGVTLSGNKTASDLSLGTYSKPSGGIPKTDLASDVQTSLGKADTALQYAPVTSVNGQTGAVTVSVPSASSATPQALGTAAAGTSTDYSRADHVHAKPTYSKSDVGLGNVDNVQQYSASNPPPYPVSSVNGSTGAVTLTIPSTASDVGAVTSNQGSGNAGKFLGIANDGTVTPESLPVDPDAKTSAMTQSVGVDSNGKLWTAPGGGGSSSEWTILHDSTTTQEAILQIAVTNISVSEFMVYIEATPTANVSVYISPNNPNGNHNDAGYGRFSIGTGTTTGNKKYGWAKVFHAVDKMLMVEYGTDMDYGGTAGNLRKNMVLATNSMTYSQKYTSISVATYQNVASGTRVVVLGR